MRILVTGASGFIGQALCPFLEQSHYIVTKVSIRDNSDIDRIDFTDIDVVIHLAALVHQMQGAPEQAYMQSNFELTKALADKAKHCGVKKFIFISTVAVYGLNSAKHKLDESAQLNPSSAYGKSKLLAEEYLQNINDDVFKVCILRLPLVYGYGAKGNFYIFMQNHALYLSKI